MRKRKKKPRSEMFPPANAIVRKENERQIIEDGTIIWRKKKESDVKAAIRERKELRDMLAAYNPWGKPGHGAPMPGALRKTKWIFEDPKESTAGSVMTLGRPGHGAPLRTISGKIKTLLKSDPSIRFQNHESSRKSVENDLRYKSSPTDKENYRKELDAIILEKHKRKPKDMENNQGWTDEMTFKRLVKSLPKGDSDRVCGIENGGVELVPLLAKNRMVNRSPLSSTDVTKFSNIQNGPTKTSATDEEYQKQLSRQVNEKQQMIQKERREDLQTSQKHFETWRGFWGRPGHGAPKALCQRKKLDIILYNLPARKGASKCAN